MAADGRLGLVMVHGFMSEPEAWQPLREQFAADPSLDFVRTLAFPYATGLRRIHPLRVFPTLNAVADSLKEYLRTEAGPFENVVMVTHRHWAASSSNAAWPGCSPTARAGSWPASGGW